MRGVGLFVIFATLSVLLCGVTTSPRFSDEIFHLWMARRWYEEGRRPVYNPLVDTLEEAGYRRYYNASPLWHLGLKSLWEHSGGFSLAAAQVYQSFFFLLLVVLGLLLGRWCYGKSEAQWTAFLCATTPFSLAFGVLLFKDIALCALVALALLPLVKGRYGLSGILLGMAFLFKRSAYLLLSSFAVVAFLRKKGGLTARFKAAVSLFLLMVLVTVPEFVYRYRNFGGLIVPEDKGRVMEVVRKVSKGVSLLSPYEDPPHFRNYLPETVTDPLNFPKYWGVSLLGLFPLFLLKRRSLWGREGISLLLIVGGYLPFYFLLFKGWLGVRYLMPLVTPVAVMGGRVVSSLRRKAKEVLIVLCVVQFGATLVYVYKERRIKPEERDVLEFIRREVPEGERILTPEELFVSYYTGRPTVWWNSFAVRPSGFRRTEDFISLMWGGEELQREVLKRYRVGWVLLFSKRVYDDTRERHMGGFPCSFVRRAFLSPLFEVVYTRKGVILLKVKENEV